MIKAHDILERRRLRHNEYIPIKRVHAVYNPLFILLKNSSIYITGSD